MELRSWGLKCAALLALAGLVSCVGPPTDLFDGRLLQYQRVKDLVSASSDMPPPDDSTVVFHRHLGVEYFAWPTPGSGVCVAHSHNVNNSEYTIGSCLADPPGPAPGVIEILPPQKREEPVLVGLYLVDNAKLVTVSCGDVALRVDRLATFGVRTAYAIDFPWFPTGTLRAEIRTPGRPDAWPFTIDAGRAQDGAGMRACP